MTATAAINDTFTLAALDALTTEQIISKHDISYSYAQAGDPVAQWRVRQCKKALRLRVRASDAEAVAFLAHFTQDRWAF
jgi:hypothetical protein